MPLVRFTYQRMFAELTIKKSLQRKGLFYWAMFNTGRRRNLKGCGTARVVIYFMND